MKTYMGLIGYYPFFFFLIYIYLLFNVAKVYLGHIQMVKHINENINKILLSIQKYYKP